MTLVQFGKISVMKLSSGEVLGFHNENLEIARLSEDLWQSLAESKLDDVAMTELKLWSNTSTDTRSHLALNSNKDLASYKTLTINSTQLCNLRCTYCAAGGDGTYGAPMSKLDLSKGLPQLEWLIMKCNEGDYFQINFLGGEPLLYPEVIESVIFKANELALKQKIHLRYLVITNGTQFNDSVLKLLTDNQISVTVSVDGPEKVQNQFRPQANGKGSFAAVQEGLQKLKEISHALPSVGLSAVFHKDHLEVFQTYQYFRSWNFDFYELNYSHTDFDVKGNDRYISEINRVAEDAHLFGGERELRKIRNLDGIFSRLDDQIRLENFCGSGRSLLSMDTKGKLYACPWDINDFNLNLSHQNGGVDSEKQQQYLDPQISKIECSTCWAKYVCGGGCNFNHRSGTGSNIKVEPIFCKRIQGLIQIAFIYYEKYRRNEHEAH